MRWPAEVRAAERRRSERAVGGASGGGVRNGNTWGDWRAGQVASGTRSAMRNEQQERSGAGSGSGRHVARRLGGHAGRARWASSRRMRRT